MSSNKLNSCIVLILSISLLSAKAQNKSGIRKKEFYISWGYNKEWFSKSTLKIDQPTLGNHYNFVGIKGHDHPGWDNGIFNKPISIPQYNYRLGLLFNKKKALAIEINFDHTKFIFADQAAHVYGIIQKRIVDTTINFSEPNFYYYLNNGANFLLFNIVKRWHGYAMANNNIQIDLLGKAGVGPVIPHVDNKLFGKANKPGFQLGGWNLGVEAAIRVTFFNRVFVEYANKLDYARYTNLNVYEGTARHAFGTYEMILNIGVSLPAGGSIKI